MIVDNSINNKAIYMSEDIIEFYRKANDEKISDTPIIVQSEEPIVEQIEEPQQELKETDTSLNSFLSILSDSIQKEKQKKLSVQTEEQTVVTPVKEEEYVVSEINSNIDGDPLDSFLDKFQNIVKANKEKKVKATTLEFINHLKNNVTKIEEERKEEPVILDDNEEVTDTPAIVVSEEIAEQEQEPIEKEIKEVKPGKKYIGELKALDKKVKKIEKPVTKSNDIKSLITQQVEVQTAKITEEVKAYAKRILDLGGGGGSVAQQFANGGTMNGSLNVTGNYLSAGVELSTLFGSGGGSLSGTVDRLVSGNESLILNSDGTVSLPNNTLRSPDDLELILESENTALSAFTQIALTPHGFLAYDSAGDSITFDSISNTIVFKTIDEYTWTLDDQGNITGPGGTLTVSGNTDTTGNILSGGRNLDQIFITYETDSQTLTYTPSSYNLSISNGNTVSLASLSGTPTDLSFLSVSANWNSTYAVVSSLSGNWNTAYASTTALNLSSTNWNTAYDIATVYASNSASYASLNYVNNNFLNLSGGIISGPVRINNNLTVFGNLTATGTTTFANTVFSVTSALSVIHVGSGPAMYVGNNGTGDIASFYDIDQNVEILHVGGINSSFPNVGIKTSSPNKTFTVVGEISATSDITTSGKFYIQGDGNSDQWNKAYNIATTYQNASGSFATNTLLQSTSALLTPLTLTRTLTSQLVLNTDSRLSDARTPTAHAYTHGQSGDDSIAVSFFSLDTIQIVEGSNLIPIGFISRTNNFNGFSQWRGDTLDGNNFLIAFRSSGDIRWVLCGEFYNYETSEYSPNFDVIYAVSTSSGNVYPWGDFINADIKQYSNGIKLRSGAFGTSYLDQYGSRGLAQTYAISDHTHPLPTIQQLGTDSRYAKLSSNAFIYDPSVSSIDTVNGNNNPTGIFSGTLGGNCNAASGNYSTVVNGFSSCATGYATFVGAGSGNRATGNYAVAVGGQCNTASGLYSSINGGCLNCATNTYSTVGGGRQNCNTAGAGTIAGGVQNRTLGSCSFVGGGCNNVNDGTFTTIVGGGVNTIGASNCWGFIGGGQCNLICNTGIFSSVVDGQCNVVTGPYSTVVGGARNTASGIYTNIVGGLGNYNPLRDSVIGGGVANHTGGYAPFNITAAASISGNGSQTCLIGTGIQNCFSYPFTSNNVSLYYSTPTIPLSSGCFTTATIAATGTNYVIINGDYSTCTSSGLSATSIYVYDRAINNTGYDNVIAGGKLNTASGCYGFIGGGFNNRIVPSINNTLACFSTIGGGSCNTASAYLATVAGGLCNTASCRGAVAGGNNNSASGYSSFVGGGGGNTASGRHSVIAGGVANITTANCAVVGGGFCNNASGTYSALVGGARNTASGAYSTIVGGRFNYNPLFNSNIAGGSFNHTGGYAPANITFGANLSGNGTQTALIATGIGSCFSNSGTTGAVSLMWMTSGTANSTLSSACFTTANVVTNAANCIIINGDYSACSTGLSACSIYVYDRCVNIGGCFNFIGGGILNTASGCYSSVVGGICSRAIGTFSFVGGGACSIASGTWSAAVGGCNTTASGNYSFVGGGNKAIASNQNSVAVGGFNSNASGNASFVGGGANNNATSTGTVTIGGCSNANSGCFSFIGAGRTNTASGTYSSIIGGQFNRVDATYSFVAGGSANDTKGFANTFILGTGLSANQVNYTYVNNLSSQGVVVANPLRVGNSQTATGPVGSVTGKVEIFNASGASLGFIPVYSTIT